MFYSFKKLIFSAISLVLFLKPAIGLYKEVSCQLGPTNVEKGLKHIINYGDGITTAFANYNSKACRRADVDDIKLERVDMPATGVNYDEVKVNFTYTLKDANHLCG